MQMQFVHDYVCRIILELEDTFVSFPWTDIFIHYEIQSL